MRKERENSFFGGVATMGTAILIVKVLGAFFKIPIVRILSEEAYADFSNAYNLYALLLTVSTAGLPVALSRIVAANHALGRERQVNKVFRVSLSVFLTLGVLSFLIMFLGGDWLAGLLHDTKAALAIRCLAPAVVCVSCTSSFRGYFQGRTNMTPSAVSQVIEALGKLVIGLPLAWLAVRAGQGDERAAAMAILGVTLGSALTLLYMLGYYALHRPVLPKSGETMAGGDILRELLSIAIPITLTSSAVSIINIFDASIVQGRLQRALGMTEDVSRSLYGAYSGVQTIYNLPASLIVAVTTCVIPFVTRAITNENHKEASKLVRTAYHLVALLVFPMGVGMSVLAEPVVRLIFHPKDPALSGSLLAVLGIASIFVCLVSVSNAVLQAYGYQQLPILVMTGAGCVMLVIDYILVGIPSVNIHGSPVGTLCCFATAAAVDFVLIRRLTPRPPRYFRLFFGPALATAGMALAAWAVYHLCALVLGNGASTVLAVLAGVGVYGFLVVYLKLLSRSELKLMPKGDKLADLLRLP